MIVVTDVIIIMTIINIIINTKPANSKILLSVTTSAQPLQQLNRLAPTVQFQEVGGAAVY